MRHELARAFTARTRRLADRLTTETVELLERCLPAEQTVAGLAELQQRYPTVGAVQIKAVCAELRRLLTAALAFAGGGARTELR